MRTPSRKFAHTAPVWISVGGKPFIPRRSEAEYFLKKTRKVIAAAPGQKFPDKESRNAAMEVYRKAEAVYAGILKKSR